jgi:antitoxin (DNA-binding transcriptional repressor) of toxin-antitoxin stability system
LQTQKVGIREFREHLASFLEASDPIAITRHGETIGIFIPARPSRKVSELEALRAAADYLDRQIASAGVSEDELLQDFKESRRHHP